MPPRTVTLITSPPRINPPSQKVDIPALQVKRGKANAGFLSCRFNVIHLHHLSGYLSYQTLKDCGLIKQQSASAVPHVHHKMARWGTLEGCSRNAPPSEVRRLLRVKKMW